MSEILLIGDRIFGAGYRQGWTVEPLKYPSGEPLISWEQMPPVRTPTMLLRPSSMDTFVAAMFLMDAMEQRDNNIFNLVIGLVPGSRQDRLNDEGDYLLTVKSVARMINAREPLNVTIFDPHSDVTPALIDCCDAVSAADVLFKLRNYKDPVGTWDVVISPDAGAEKRASAVARMLGVPLMHAWKTRDVATGKISGFGIEDLPVGLTILSRPIEALIVDDICDGGGTFLGLREEIDKKVPHMAVDLYVTHGIFSNGAVPKLKKVFRDVITTDTVCRGSDDGLHVIKICESIAYTKG